MTVHKIGNVRRLSITFYSDANKTTPADPTTVVFKLQIPGSDVVEYTYGVNAEIVKDSTGAYHFDLSLTLEGTYSYSWHGTGAVIFADDGVLVAQLVEPA